MVMHITITTKVDVGDQTIEQKTVTDTGDQISRMLYEAQEEQMRQALIMLGWTPPSENTNRGGH